MGSFTPPPTTALAPGDRLDRYELLCVLAQGGMGTVWLARMTGKLGFERLVALKTILPTYSNDRQFGDMFLDEAKLAAQIDHENVARILEIGEDRGLLYYAMELIDGESLRKLYRDVRATNTSFPIGVALRIVADACAGLHATHELHGEDGRPLQVVHRDVSPQNLLISVRGTTKLIDFGVAKANARSSEETAAGTLKGKIEYMAPEQAQGAALDRRADVYSLGAVLYELLAGRPVFITDDGRQLAALHDLMTGAPYTPLPPSIPPVVRQIVDRALARDPARRFASAEELRRALEHAMSTTGQRSTTDDVAKVLAHFSGERTAKRKDAIERALRAATDGRLNAATIVAPLSAQALPGSLGGSAPGASGSGSGPRTGPGTPHGYYASPSGPLLPMAPPSGHGVDGSNTGPSMRTLGAASMSAHPSPGSSAAKVIAGLVLLGLVAAAGIVIGVVLTRRAQQGAVAAASSTVIAPAATTGEPSAPVVPGDTAPAVVPAVADPATASSLASLASPASPASPATGVTPASPVIGASPMTSSTHATHGGKDAGTTASGSSRKPDKKPPAKPGAKPGDGDEYGF
jgi:serine/threonine-protein kinase